MQTNSTTNYVINESYSFNLFKDPLKILYAIYNAPIPTILDSRRVYNEPLLSIGSETINTNPPNESIINARSLIIANTLYANNLVFGKFMWLRIKS